jgi:hypothetical protein
LIIDHFELRKDPPTITETQELHLLLFERGPRVGEDCEVESFIMAPSVQRN